MTFKTSDPNAFAQLTDGQRIRLVDRPDITYTRNGNTMEMDDAPGGYGVDVMADHFQPDDQWELINDAD